MRGRRAFAAAALAAAVALAAAALAQDVAQGSERVVAGLSQDRIAITTRFSGSEVLVFGAVRREAPPPAIPLEVIVTLEGPATPVTVRRKARMMGIWINRAAVEVDHAPSFYAVATTAPLAAILTETEDLRHAISVPRAIRSVGAAVEDSPAFTEALIRIRGAEGNYRLTEGAVEIAEQTLFRARFHLPANLIEGDYRTRIFLTRQGRVVDRHEATIAVGKEGIERYLFTMSRDMPWAYGALSLILAVAAGWAASAGFAYLRR